MKTNSFRFALLLAAFTCWQADAQIYDTNGEVVQPFVGSQFYGY